MASERLRRAQTAAAGAALALVGAVALDYYVFGQLRAADAGAPVELASKSLVMAPGLFAAGVVMMVFALTPRIWKRDLLDNVLPVTIGVVVVAIAFTSGFFLRLWLKAELRAKGYEFP